MDVISYLCSIELKMQRLMPYADQIYPTGHRVLPDYTEKSNFQTNRIPVASHNKYITCQILERIQLYGI